MSLNLENYSQCVCKMCLLSPSTFPVSPDWTSNIAIFSCLFCFYTKQVILQSTLNMPLKGSLLNTIVITLIICFKHFFSLTFLDILALLLKSRCVFYMCSNHSGGLTNSKQTMHSSCLLFQDTDLPHLMDVLQLIDCPYWISHIWSDC